MPQRFKDAMRELAGAVTIITAGSGADAAGLTATAVCSLSMEPPRLLVCINRAGATFAALLASGEFCVNVLNAGQADLAAEFAGRTGKAGVGKFVSADWELYDAAPPRHLGALTAVHCKVHAMTILGTHAIVIGDVIETHMGNGGAALIYRDQRFLSA